MRNAFLITSFALICCFSMYAASPQEFLHFSIQLPDGYRLVDKSPNMMDFNLYEIRNSKKVVVARMYVGNHPNTKRSINEPQPAPGKVALAMTESPIASNEYELIIKFAGLKYKGLPSSPWTSIYLFDVINDMDVRNLIISSAKSIAVVRQDIQ